MTKAKKVNIITLGCSKNLVDSELLARQLSANGHQVSHEEQEPREVTIINTCGFINDAKQESIETILEQIEVQKQHPNHQVYVMGCLSQRYRQELAAEIPEVDGYFGVDQIPDIVETLNGRFDQALLCQRNLATPAHYAYLKIAEGCDRKCSFCSIPLIRGKYKFKPVEELQKEAAYLNRQGVQELNLIAQDLTYYGRDLGNKSLLAELLQRLDERFPFEWIRLLYAYPLGFPTEVLEQMSQSRSLCKYLDLPLQHISDRILYKMRRGHRAKQTYDLIELTRNKVPDITLRTTLMVGYPGEDERDFARLMEFVREVEFDRLGVFTYSEEEGTHAARTEPDDVPEHIKRERADELMGLQQEIAYRKNQEKVQQTHQVLIDRCDDRYYYGRTESDAPEVDNEVLIDHKDCGDLQTGRFYQVQITSASAYELYGVPENISLAKNRPGHDPIEGPAR